MLQIVLLSDSPTILDIYTEFLKELKYHVHTGELESAHTLLKQRPHIVIIDAEPQHHIFRNWRTYSSYLLPSARVLALSYYQDAKQFPPGIHLCQKPVFVQELRSIIEQFLTIDDTQHL